MWRRTSSPPNFGILQSVNIRSGLFLPRRSMASAPSPASRISYPLRIGTTSGDESLNELFGNCMPRLFRVADCILHNCHDSEDALQDGLLSALRHIDQFKGNSRFSTWLFSIIRNSALGKLRSQRAHRTIPMEDQFLEDESESRRVEVPSDPGPDPERACAQAELSYQFAQTLESLPASYRAIIRLCDFEGFSGKEAAKRLGPERFSLEGATSSCPRGHSGIHGRARCRKRHLAATPIDTGKKWM